MNLLKVLIVLLLCSVSTSNAQSFEGSPEEQELYEKLSQQFSVKFSKTGFSVSSFLQAFSQTNDWRSENSAALLKQYFAANAAWNDSDIIKKMTGALCLRFIETDLMKYSCPAGYEGSLPVMQHYSDAVCECLEAKRTEVMSDDSGKSMGMIKDCMNAFKAKSATNTRLFDSIQAEGAKANLFEQCLTAYPFVHCQLFKRIILKKAYETAFERYRLYRTVELMKLAMFVEKAVADNDHRPLVKAYCDTNKAMASEMKAAVRYAFSKVPKFGEATCYKYKEVGQYGNLLKQSIVLLARRKQEVACQLVFDVRWKGAEYKVVGFNLLESDEITADEREHVFSSLVEMFDNYSKKK